MLLTFYCTVLAGRSRDPHGLKWSRRGKQASWWKDIIICLGTRVLPVIHDYDYCYGTLIATTLATRKKLCVLYFLFTVYTLSWGNHVVCDFILSCRDSIGDCAVAGDTRWAGTFGVNVDFVARSHCSVALITMEDIQVVILILYLVIKNCRNCANNQGRHEKAASIFSAYTHLKSCFRHYWKGLSSSLSSAAFSGSLKYPGLSRTMQMQLQPRTYSRPR